MEPSNSPGQTNGTLTKLKSNLYNRQVKKMYIKEVIQQNPGLDLRQILAKLHDHMGKRTAKEWLEAMELNGEIEIREEPKGKFVAKVTG